MAERQYVGFCFIIVGTNGTGKTTLTKKLIDNRETLVVIEMVWVSMMPTIDIGEITQLKEGKKHESLRLITRTL